MDNSQFAKDLQAHLNGLTTYNVYEGEAPRDDVGAITVNPPFVVYSLVTLAPLDEANIYTYDLIIDIWGRGSWTDCYTIAQAIDNALNGTVNTFTSGTMCSDQNGQICARNERDPDDERIRRLSSQYKLRFYPTT